MREKEHIQVPKRSIMKQELKLYVAVSRQVLLNFQRRDICKAMNFSKDIVMRALIKFFKLIEF